MGTNQNDWEANERAILKCPDNYLLEFKTGNLADTNNLRLCLVFATVKAKLTFLKKNTKRPFAFRAYMSVRMYTRAHVIMCVYVNACVRACVRVCARVCTPLR